MPFGSASYLYCFQSNGRAKTATWETINDSKHYFQSNGRAVRDAFATIDGKIYRFDNKAAVISGGWFCAGNGYYYADSTGALATNTVLEGYKLDANGKSATKYRIIQLANEHTDSSMTDQQKIDALYNWVLKNNMIYIRTYEHAQSSWVWKDSWVDDMATSILDNWGGNCYRYAALLGMLIHEATDLPVTVYHGKVIATSGGITHHGWTTVQQDGEWYIYDVELQKFTSYTADDCYKILASQAPLHSNGVGTNLYS